MARFWLGLKHAFWRNLWQHTRTWLRSDRVRLWLIHHEPRRRP